MSQFDSIVNPTTGKKVKVSSSLGKLILNSYSQFAGGDSFEEEHIPTNHEKRLQIHELITTDYREWFSDDAPEYNYTVFFENDEVKVSPRTAYYSDHTPDELKLNNSVGTIVDPRKLGINLTNNENIAFKYFHPEDLVDHSQFSKGNFIYTDQSGLELLEFNKVLYSTGNVGEALGEEPSNEMINYAQEYGNIDIEFNKTTSHPDDVSFYSIHDGIDENENEKLYMVKWEKEGEQFLSLMPVSHLLFANTFTEESDTESDSDSDPDSESDSQSESSSVESDDFSRAIGHIIPDDESIHGSETHSLQGLDELSADPLPIEDVSLDLSTIDPLTQERQDDEFMERTLSLPEERQELEQDELSQLLREADLHISD